MERALVAALQQIEIGVLVVDPQRRIRANNPAAQRLLGTREHGLVGRSLVEATLSYEILNLVGSAQQSGEIQERELRHNEGTGRTLRVRVVPQALEHEERGPAETPLD